MAREKVKKPFYKKVWFWILAVIIVVGISGSLGSNDNATVVANNETKENTQTTNETQNDQAQEETKEEKSVPKEYENALNKAQIYSDTMYMSKKAIHKQLTSEYGEKFSKKAADYAMENLKANYKKNALEKAKTYQNDMSMSKDAIYDQLISDYGEQFTKKEAQYALDHLED